ncbi:MAG: hypothetical protein V7L25_31795 [Nostoc sp.]|uniref:hypothetical protein n=1 Tax=Nostoc sp. TaxID=1180 RepID=UPI002FEEF144
MTEYCSDWCRNSRFSLRPAVKSSWIFGASARKARVVWEKDWLHAACMELGWIYGACYLKPKGELLGRFVEILLDIFLHFKYSVSG